MCSCSTARGPSHCICLNMFMGSRAIAVRRWLTCATFMLRAVSMSTPKSCRTSCRSFLNICQRGPSEEARFVLAEPVAVIVALKERLSKAEISLRSNLRDP